MELLDSYSSEFSDTILLRTKNIDPSAMRTDVPESIASVLSIPELGDAVATKASEVATCC